MKDNLAFMLVHARQQGARVLLVGMRLPPNYGQKYTQEFDAAFRDLAKREKVRLRCGNGAICWTKAPPDPGLALA